MLSTVKPALGPNEWNQRRSGALRVEAVDEKSHVIVGDPNGEIVTVSGDDELFALMALANSAMSDDDPRKLCRKDLAVLSVLCEQYHCSHDCDKQILSFASALYDKLCALLPSLTPSVQPSSMNLAAPESGGR